MGLIEHGIVSNNRQFNSPIATLFICLFSKLLAFPFFFFRVLWCSFLIYPTGKLSLKRLFQYQMTYAKCWVG